jgi:DNA integrity scanning protein DisA with diadenylate cyclase activity/mannitol/fructose-specific phosphotransferase system IIA component (Ntr-type)
LTVNLPQKPPPERLSRYLREEAVVDLAVDSKEALLRRLAETVVEQSRAEVVDKVYRGILEREAQVNTYVGNGVAIPHARVDCVEGISLALARNPGGLPYGIQTDEPVVLVVLVVGNDALQSEHVRVLSLIASLLGDRDSRDRILKAPDAASVLRLIDAQRLDRQRRRPRPLTQLMLSHARKIAREMGVTTILVNLDTDEELQNLRRIPKRESFVAATSSLQIAEKAERVVKRVLRLPPVAVHHDARVRLTALMALNQGLISRGDLVAFLSGSDEGGLDTMTVIEVGRQFGRFVTPAGEFLPGIVPGVLERVLTLATELAVEGREARRLGALFVVVRDVEKLRPFCQQMVMNPFRGYPEEERNILDPTLAETIKEFAAIDGAFIVAGTGVVVSAGTYLKADQEVDLPGGLGARHRSACGITKAVDCVSVALSQSTGSVTVFKSGQEVVSLPRP